LQILFAKKLVNVGIREKYLDTGINGVKILVNNLITLLRRVRASLAFLCQGNVDEPQCFVPLNFVQAGLGNILRETPAIDLGENEGFDEVGSDILPLLVTVKCRPKANTGFVNYICYKLTMVVSRAKPLVLLVLLEEVSQNGFDRVRRSNRSGHRERCASGLGISLSGLNGVMETRIVALTQA